MGNPFQQGTHSCSGPGPESCQNLGEYILIFLGFIISINIGINVVTLLRCHLGGSLNHIFHNFFQEDNTLELAPIIPKKQLICRPPALKQTRRPPAYQDPPVCKNPPICQNPTICWNHSVCQNSAVCRNLAVHRNPAVCDLCTMDSVTLDLAPPGSCRRHSVFSQEPNQCLDARLPNGDDKVSQSWHPGCCPDNCQCDWDSPMPQAQWKGLSACPPFPGVHFQQYLGRSANGVEAKPKMGLEACVYPINPSSYNAESQSCKESTEPDMYGCSPQFFHRVTVSPLSCKPLPATNHVTYNGWKKKRQVWEASRGVDSLPHACPPDSLEKPSQDWVYYSLEE
ncbi:spermatid maturation protein 1-like [Trichosurus vulpecula]|uniref:spermatid maturation protein 1-like n=1 Tax=Trichosurus vulpecula TaxID=9337 RepID=UPI00186B49D0|nr:spermatid maturation protein 1-like [Trichosurus vulpecula]